MTHRKFVAAALLLTGCTTVAPVRPVATVAPTPFASASAPPPIALASAPPLAAPVVEPKQPTGLLVPLYEPPSRPGWSELAALKRRHPTIPVTAIVNPDNGPSWGPDPAYDAGIAALQDAGITVVGYLSTNYGKPGPAKVTADLARWKKRAPGLGGLFIDEMATTAGAAPFYAAVVAQAHGHGLGLVIGNVGTTPAPAIAALVDIVVAYEKPGMPRSAPAGLERAHVAALAYEVPRLDAALVQDLGSGYGWLYVTEASLAENPWGHLSRHAEALAAALDPALH